MTDWKLIVSELVAAKMSLPQIAAECGDTHPSTIRELRDGGSKEPRHALGQKLLKLHKRHAKRAAA